jgi:hypothetical protein
MSMNFTELLILLLPGFLGLWTFKRIVQENIDKREESTQLALALLLGLSSLFCAVILLASCLYLPDSKSLKFHALAIQEILSPATGESGKGAYEFFRSPHFWVFYVFLCFMAVCNGFIWAMLSEIGWTPTVFLRRLAAKILKRPPKESCESSLRAVVNSLNMEKNGPNLVRVYKLGENQGKSIIGFWSGYSETEKEIDLTRIELCESAPDLVSIIEKLPRRCWINHESGIIIEFVEVDKEYNKAIEEYLRSKYRKWRTGIVRLG